MLFSKTSNMLADAAAKRAPRFSSPASFGSIMQFRKFYSLVVLANVFVMFCSLQGTEAFSDVPLYKATIDGRTCVENFDPNVDYFEDNKITAAFENEDIFVVEYHKFFKTVQLKTENSFVNYVLWLCGTREPTAQEIIATGLTGDNEVVQIPPTSYGISSQNDAAFFQQLGALDTLKFASTASSYPTCIDGKYYEAAGGCFTPSCPFDEWNSMGSCAPEVFFTSGTPTGDIPANAHVVNLPYTQALTSVSSRVDKILYYSTFLNRESIAMQTVTGINEVLDCIENAYTPSSPKKNVLMLTYFFAGTFGTTKCPNYYCDVFEDRFGENLISTAELEITSFFGNAPKENITSKIAELGLDVDLIILNQPADTVDTIPGPDANGATEFTSLVNTIASNQGYMPAVFDSIGNAEFFYSYEALPELLMNDWLFMLDETVASNAVGATGPDSNNGMFFYEHFPKLNNASAIGSDIFSELCTCHNHALTLASVIGGSCANTALETARSNFNAGCDENAGSNFLTECGFLSSPANQVELSLFASLMLVFVAAFGMN